MSTKLSDLPANLSYFSLCQIQDIFRYANPQVSLKRLPDALVELDELGNVWPLGNVGLKFGRLKDGKRREAIREACGANLPYSKQVTV